MIYFFTDDHFRTSPGRVLLEALPERLRRRIVFAENDFTLLESGAWLRDCELLMLNMIGGTCGNPHAGTGAEKAVRQWYGNGGSFLLFHGSSAAFWQWDWWRKASGYRWVRPGDPDGVESSVHPMRPYAVELCKCRHPLTGKLKPFRLPKDEIYTALEQTAPGTVLMQTRLREGTWPQCMETLTPSGGRILAFLPGHAPKAVRNTALVRDAVILIDYLLNQQGRQS